jgi:hypothetical protein
MRIDFDLEDLTNSALKRLVKQLLTATDKQEQSVMAKLSKAAKGEPEKNELADLDEEMHGKPNTPMVDEEDDPFEDDDEDDKAPKGKKR